MPQLFFNRDALAPEIRAAIHALLLETSRHRPLTKLEIRVRCLTAPAPWRDAGVDRSTWYRRRKREQQAEPLAEAA
jgi:hypothetical protein